MPTKDPKAKPRRGNFEGSIYIRNKGKKNQLYCGSVSVAPLDRRTVYGRDEKTVKRKMRDLQAAAESGTLAEPNRHTVATWMEAWLEDVIRPSRRETTTILYRGIVRLHIVPFIGPMKLTKLAPIHLQNLYAKLEREGRSARMRQHVHLRLHAALKRAKRLRLIPNNPTEDVDAPRAPKRAMETLDRDQARALLEAAHGNELEALYVLAITTGMRQGEMLGLRWQDVDISGAVLVVQHSLAWVAGEMRLLQPKTPTSRRRIDLSAVTVHALGRHREAAVAAGRSVDGDDFVFRDRDGGPLRKENLVRRSFEPLLTKAELPRIRFHDLRHTSASLLLASGASVKVAQERLGHARASITLDTYAHTVRSMQREAAAFFDDLLG